MRWGLRNETVAPTYKREIPMKQIPNSKNSILNCNMARYINGKIKGKLGNMVGFELKGKNYMRTKPVRKAPPTEGELKNRFLLELVANWLKPLTPYLRQGFRNYSWNFEGYSAAFSVAYKEALIKDGLDSYINPALVKVSSGDLGLSENLQVTLAGDQLQFTWTPAINNTQGPRDRIMLLAYNPTIKQAIYELNGAIRYQGNDSLSLTQTQPGSFHIYAAFVAEDGSRQSDSRCLGEVTI